MTTTRLESVIAKVIATERNRRTRGIPVVIEDSNFDRIRMIRRIVSYFLTGEPLATRLDENSGSYDPTTTDPPTALVCMRNEQQVQELKAEVNRGLQTGHGRHLLPGTRPHEVAPLMFGTYGALRDAQLDTDAFDLVVVNALVPNELNRFRGMFSQLEDAFRVVIITGAIFHRGELNFWPGLEPPHFINRPRHQHRSR